MRKPSDYERTCAFRIEGLVQGVGFRPHVWRLATAFGLAGRVLNDGQGVLVELAGTDAAIDEFRAKLLQDPPPLARVDSVREVAPRGGSPGAGFRIEASAIGEIATGILPDAATCPECLAEIRDAKDRRHGYAFTNCTHCGPRFTIVEGIPYDRRSTTMRRYAMCAECAAEYADPADRRFHAQANACPACGPALWLEDAGGVRLRGDPVEEAARRLREGGILAIKGIGGFHLACDALNEDTVATLRRRKRREAKPFAVMMADPAAAARYCQLAPADREALESAAAPLVLMAKSAGTSLADSVAPGQPDLAVLLPYSPLHHLLMDAYDGPLVMTSANETGAPQVIDNDEARRLLVGIADGFLMHDRPIARRADDSVVRVQRNRVRMLRRARGYAPAPIRLHDDFRGLAPVLAMGPELKATACLLQDGRAILTQHLGDLEEVRALTEYERTISLYCRLLDFAPAVISIDMHRLYRSAQAGERLAAEHDLPIFRIQHHHAHIASVMAEAGAPPDAPPVLGIVMDGIGAGEDGEGWGCEFMLADFRGYRRLGSLRPAPLPGGAKAMREPWRNLLAQLEVCFGWEVARARWGGLDCLRALTKKNAQLLAEAVRKGVNAPSASSAGRLFDAVAAALGIRFDAIAFEGQAAMELEGLARTISGDIPGYPFGRLDVAGLPCLDPAPMWQCLMHDLEAGAAREVMAARFHSGLAEAAGRFALELAHCAGTDRIALSGGVFQNRTLAAAIHAKLTAAGIEVLENAEVPCNDGGVSLGQAAIASVRAFADGQS